MKKLIKFLKDYNYSNPQYGYRDEEGNVVIEPQFFWAFGFDESGYARVWVNKDDDTYSLINEKGEIVYKTPYKDIYEFHDGYAVVLKGDKYGVIDTKFKEVVPCSYDIREVSYKLKESLKNNDKVAEVDTVDKEPSVSRPKAKTEPLRYLKQLQEMFDGMWGRIHFRNTNPKYPSQYTGVFYIGFSDISAWKYTIREKKSNEKYDDDNDPIVATYESMKSILLDGWEAD